MSLPAAVIFDLDDTLVATGAVWRSAERRLCQMVGVPPAEVDFDQFNGHATREIVQALYQTHRPQVSFGEGLEFFEAALLAGLHTETVELKPGALALLDRAATAGPLAVASGSPPSVIRAVLSRWKLTDRFACVVSSMEVAAGKPSPLVFEATARRLGLAPERCLVIEDSLAGVLAAKRAEMTCYAVPSLPAQAPALHAHADRVFHSLDAIDSAALTGPFRSDRFPVA